MSTKITFERIFIVILFLRITLLHAQDVNISPSERLVAPLGGHAHFICSSRDIMIERIQWLINKTFIENLSPSQGVQVSSDFNTEFRTGILEFENLTVYYNMSRIQCTANGISSLVTVLLVQGHLSAVGNLMITVADSIATLTWTPPVEGSVTGYCVDIYRSNVLVNSECDIQETRYSYSLPPDSVCHIYNFTVTPVSQAGFGEIDFIAPTKQLEVPTEPVLDAEDGHSYVISMSAGVCSAELTFEDLDTGESITLKDEDLAIGENNITFSTELLTDNRHYNVAANASSVAGSSTSYATLSTHDILNATTTETGDDAIVITTLYSEHSDARGALFDFVFIDDNGDVDFTRSVLLALDRNTSLHHTLPFNLYPGQYRVFVYDIESDGTLSNGVGYPAVTNELIASENSQDFPLKSSQSCVIATSFDQSPGEGRRAFYIEAKCVSATAAGFQMIAQLSDSSEVHKLHVNQSMDLQTPVTVQVEESGVYLITIIPITEEAGIVGSGVEEVLVDITTLSIASGNTGSTTGVVVGLFILLLGVVILPAIILVYVWYCKTKKKQEHESIEHYCIEMGEQKQVDDISNSNQEDIEEQEMDAVLDDNGLETTTEELLPTKETGIDVRDGAPVYQCERIMDTTSHEEPSTFSMDLKLSKGDAVDDEAAPTIPEGAVQETEGENLSEHQSPHPGMVTHMVYQEPTTNGSEEASVQEKRQSYFVHRVQKLKAENVDVLVEGMHLHAQEQLKEIGLKIGNVLGVSEKSSLKELLYGWVTKQKKSEVATRRELTHALDQVGLTELSDNMPSQDIEAKDVDSLVEKIYSHPWKKIGIALGSSEKELDQTNPEQYLREILNVWLKSSEYPTLDGLTRALGFRAINKGLKP